MKTFIIKNKEKIISILVLIAVFLSLIFPYADYDWGWHYQYGKYLLTTGHLLRSDIFSWTMEGYKWINHEWLFDPVIYLVFKYSGYIGASLVGTLISFFCFFLITWRFKLAYWKLAIAALFFIQISQVVIGNGLRAQVLALLPLCLLIYILMRSNENFKLLWSLPLLMLLWANVHGTFVYGLLIIAIFFGIWFFRYPKKRLLLIGVGILSIAVTLLNPYTTGVYFEVFKHTSSPYLKNVFEWLPITNDCSNCHTPVFFFYLIVLVFAFIDTPTIKNLPFLIIGLVFVIPTISYRRNLPVFALATLPLLLSYMESWKFDLAKYKVTPFIFLIGAFALIEYNLFTRLPGFNFYKYNEYDYCFNASSCSIALADYLKANPPKGRGLNHYSWGGYFIGKELLFKLFLDGRMHLWKNSDGYMAFADFMSMYYDSGNIDKFNEYNFDWAIVEPDSVAARDILDKRVKGNWVIKYEDELSIYFVNEKDK
jgi:hypothetical protein